VGADAALVQRFNEASNTMTELGKLAALGGTALLLGGDAQQMQLAMGTAQNAVQNNRQLHPYELTVAKTLAANSNGKYTVQQIEEQMRLMGNQATGEKANTVTVLHGDAIAQSRDGKQDALPLAVQGNVAVEQAGQANMTIQQYIVSNTAQGAGGIPGGGSPYVYSNPALNRPATTTGPMASTTTARCANGDLACISGVGVQQSSLPALTQAARDVIADGAATTSRGAGVVASGATAFAVGGSPGVKPIAGTIAIGATVIGAVADGIEQVARPDMNQVFREQLLLGVPAAVLIQKFPLFAPTINEIQEQLQNFIKEKSR
jgi:filamentous hemagglutinin